MFDFSFLQKLDLSDRIQFFFSCATTLLAVVSAIIAICTLRQNNKMIESSTRPCVQIYPVFAGKFFYIVIKNFGASEAYIDCVSCSHNFTPDETLCDDMGSHIFDVLSGAMLAPGASIQCPLSSKDVSDETYSFLIKYHSSAKCKRYRAHFDFNPATNAPFAYLSPTGKTAEDHLRNISKSLDEISKSKF